MRGAWASECGRRAAGARGGELLPLLLKPGSLTKMPKAERAALRRRVGIDSFADMARALLSGGVCLCRPTTDRATLSSAQGVSGLPAKRGCCPPSWVGTWLIEPARRCVADFLCASFACPAAKRCNM